MSDIALRPLFSVVAAALIRRRVGDPIAARHLCLGDALLSTRTAYYATRVTSARDTASRSDAARTSPPAPRHAASRRFVDALSTATLSGRQNQSLCAGRSVFSAPFPAEGRLRLLANWLYGVFARCPRSYSGHEKEFQFPESYLFFLCAANGRIRTRMCVFRRVLFVELSRCRFVFYALLIFTYSAYFAVPHELGEGYSVCIGVRNLIA